MKKYLIGAASIALISVPSNAQEAIESVASEAVEIAPDKTVPYVAPTIATPKPMPITLSANTPIKLMVTKEVNSSTHEEGDTFELSVAEDVSIGDTVVIPRGTPATSEITWRTGKGAFGKSGKMEFAINSINLDGQKIPVSGAYRQEGEGNTVATGVGLLAVGVFAGFITGKRARLPAGRELVSMTVSPVTFNADGQISASYDSKAAMSAAEANTPIGACKIEARALATEKAQRKAKEKCYSKRME